MQNVLLVVELILAICLIGIVLLQRSEGAGGLGMSGGNATGRTAQTALGRLTWYLGLAFFAVSIGLTLVEARMSGNSSILDRLGVDASPEAPAPATPALPEGEGLLPPKASDAPVTPPPAP